MRRVIVAFALLATGAALSAGQATPSAADLAAKVQSHYDTVKDFQTDFTSVYRGGFMKAMPPERGTIQVKKPGRIRWVYETPERREWWSDGSKVYMFLPASKQGQISPLPANNDSSTSLLFLMDRGNLVRDFNSSVTGDQPAGQWRLTLVPKRPDPDLTSLVLVVDRTTFKLGGFETKDDQGGTTTIQFQNFKENVGLRDQVFAKNPPFPKGTDIIK